MVAGDLSSFPVLVDTTDTDLASKAQSNGNDILFTDIYNNKLNHEIEYYASGHVVAWVNVPTVLSSMDIVLYMYYGNSTCGSQENVSGVWDSHYMLIQHLSETSGIHYDSTDHDNDGIPHGGITQGSTGQIDGADVFDGSNDYVQIPHNNTISGFTTGMTASAWIRLDGNSSWVTILNKYNTSNSQRGWQVYYDGSLTPKELHLLFLSDTF
jgi:MSHA biogenesis protein MshQ